MEQEHNNNTLYGKLKDKYDAYIDSLNSYRDLENCMDTAKEEGEKLKTMEIAKKMKLRGIPFDQISDITGLTIEEIIDNE